MNDTDLTVTIRRALHARATEAPVPNGLLETVKRRSRRRGLRHLLTAAVSGLGAAGVAAAGFAIPNLLAQPGLGEAFADHRVDVCVHDGSAPDLWVVDRRGDDLVDTANSRGNTPPSVDLTVAESGFELNIGVHPALGHTEPLTEVRDITVDGHDGRVGVSERYQRPVVRVDSGVDGFTVVVAVRDGDPTATELAAFAATIDIHATTTPCEGAT